MELFGFQRKVLFFAGDNNRDLQIEEINMINNVFPQLCTNDLDYMRDKSL